MIASERNLYIMSQLNTKGIINLKQVAQEIGISETTVRRDFEKLEQQGKLKRVQGGAARTGNFDALLENAELTMRSKIALNSDQKEKIACYAAQCVQEGECVFLDGGTSIAPMIHYLANKRIKIVTHNNLITQKLNNPVAEIFLIGGLYLPHYSMSVGPIAVNLLQQFRFDRAFIGCSGVDLRTQVAFTAEIETMAMKEAGMKNATKSYLLIDSSKLAMRGFCRFKTLNVFDQIICNDTATLECDPPQNLKMV